MDYQKTKHTDSCKEYRTQAKVFFFFFSRVGLYLPPEHAKEHKAWVSEKQSLINESSDAQRRELSVSQTPAI